MSFSLCVSWRWGKKGVFVHSGEAAPVQVLPRGGQEGDAGPAGHTAGQGAAGRRSLEAGVPPAFAAARFAARGLWPQFRAGIARAASAGRAGGCGGLPGGVPPSAGHPLGSRGFPPFPATAGPGPGRLRPEPCRAGLRAGWPLPAGKKAGIPVQKEVGSRGPFVKLRDRPKRRIPAAVAGIGMLRDGRERLREDACRHVPACRENAGRLHRSPRV